MGWVWKALETGAEDVPQCCKLQSMGNPNQSAEDQNAKRNVNSNVNSKDCALEIWGGGGCCRATRPLVEAELDIISYILAKNLARLFLCPENSK